MDKKYTSLENQIRNVVRGASSTGESKSLESKIRDVVLNEGMAGYTASSERTEDGHRAVVKDSKGQTRYAGSSVYPTKKHAINGADIYIRNGGGENGSDMERDYNKQVRFQTHVGGVDLGEGSEKFAKIVARTAAARGEPITTDLAALQKKHAQIQATATAAAQHAAQAQKDYEDLVKKYGGQVEEEVEVDEALSTGGNEGGEYKGTPPAFFKSFHVEPKVGDTHPTIKSGAAISRDRAKIASSETMKKEGYIITPTGRSALEERSISIPNPLPALANLFKGGSKSAGKPSPKPPSPGKGKPTDKSGVGSAISKMGTGAGIASIAAELLGGGGAAATAIKSSRQSEDGVADDISNLTVNRHYTKGRVYHGPEIHYNEYEPELDYIGEDSAEQTDAERSAIENVARPNSKNKLTKQTEIQRKINEDTARRKSVILKAKEENKSGKDGANGMVETKPELKQVHELAIPSTSDVLKGTGKVAGKVTRTAFGPLGTLASTAYDAKTAIDAGEDPERVALRTGLGAAGGVAGGVLGGGLGTVLGIPSGPGAVATGIVGGTAGAYGGSELGDYVGSKLYDTGIYGKGKAFVKGAVDTASDVSDTVSNAYNKVKGALTSPTMAGGGSTMFQPKSSTPAQGLSLAGGGGMIGQKPLVPSTPAATPKPTPKSGSAVGTAAGKAIAKVAPKPTPKPTPKLPGPGTPGYRTDAQMNDYEAKRAELLNKYSGSAGAQSAGNRSVEAATKSLATNTPVVAPQPSPEINRTNAETPRSMGSSWNNSYKNKYSMGPGPSQFPSK